MKIEDKKFNAETVQLDGNQFTECEFTNCVVQIAGVMPFQLAACSFNNCDWEFIGPASNTLKFMATFYAQGGEMKALIESTIDAIRTGGVTKPVN